jgi:pyruvate, water dikinase
VILRFHEELPVELAGCKARNLSLMFRAGLPVPPGFCVTSDAMENVALPDLTAALADIDAASYAVRSSAVQEDSMDASFAGMLTSRLNIMAAEDVLTALRDIHASAATPSAEGYSRRLKVRSSVRIAGVVQEFLPAEAAGVLFMRDPQAVGSHFVLEACWGLGVGVVEGVVRPDRWTVSADGEVISALIADKDIAIVASRMTGTTQISVDPTCRRRPCLTAQSLRELATLASECEQLFRGPQDIEWAFWQNRVWLLQSRPITV